MSTTTRQLAPGRPAPHASNGVGETGDEGRLGRLAWHCIGRVARLLARRQLHLHHDRVGDTVALPDGRPRDAGCGPVTSAAPDVPVALCQHRPALSGS